MDFPADWKPTRENINALPLPLRWYIHSLEEQTDPQGVLRENYQLKEENRLLRFECERLARKS